LNTTRQRGEIIGDGVQDPTATAHPGLLFAADFRLLQQGRQQDFNSPTFSQQGGAFDSSRLAQMVGQLHRQDPGLLGNLLGGAPGGGNPQQSTRRNWLSRASRQWRSRDCSSVKVAVDLRGS